LALVIERKLNEGIELVPPSTGRPIEIYIGKITGKPGSDNQKVRLVIVDPLKEQTGTYGHQIERLPHLLTDIHA